MSESMFIKVSETTEEEKPKPKPKKKKKQLSEKQLEGLARGRAKMAEKRKLKKAMEAKRKELAEMDKNAEVENQLNTKHGRQRKKKIIVESESVTEQAISFKKKRELQNLSLDKFNKLKVGALKHIETSEELDEFESIMGGVTKDMAKEPEKLYSYLREHSDRLINQGKQKLVKKNVDID